MRELERIVLLRVVDEYWMDHIDAMSDLRQGITLRAYAQTNPVDEYKREGFEMFEAMINGIKEEVVRRIFTVRISKENPLQRKSVSRTAVAGANAGGDSSVKKQPVKVIKKPGRNDPCPCGKWKADGSRPLKYKECCGRNE
jgi:preprotein translocase subunit SecA